MSSLNLAITSLASRIGASIDGDWCGTKVPRPPLPRALEAALGNSRFEQLMLNPQPLPPAPNGSVFQQVGRASLDDDWCGTVPKRFPPPPPLPGLDRFGPAGR
jgi:hypothetical protein